MGLENISREKNTEMTNLVLDTFNVLITLICCFYYIHALQYLAKENIS